MDADNPSAVSSPTETRAVTCARCNQTLLVLVSDAQPPCFREPKEQAKCPEIAERIARGEQAPDLTVCDALRRSLEAKSGSLEVDAIVHDGIWYVVRRAPGEPSPLYSPAQARTQAELWSGRGQSKLADQFLWAADKAESLQFDAGAQARLPGSAVVFVIMLAVAVVAGWYYLLQPSMRVGIERPPASSGNKLATAKPASESTALPTAAPPTTAPPMTAAPAVPAPAAPPAVPANAVQPSPTPTPTPAPAPSATAPARTAETAGAAAAVIKPQSGREAAPEKPSPAARLESTASVAPAASPAAPEPDMIPLPGGSFAMGSNDDYSERPIHNVTIKAFAIGKFPVTVREWNACVAAKGCALVVSGKDDAPVTNLNWSDAQQFATWLAAATGKPYRLPSEAEWEYAARGGTSTAFWWGKDVQPGMANCRGCNEPYDSKRPAAVGSFKPNPFGLYDMGGDVGQWVADCWHKDYRGAPTDGSPWIDDGACPSRVFRSGSWKNQPADVRAASRAQFDFNARYPTLGLRVARSP
jgi:formylglycine-generating enzyme required for sulfatase activity